MENTTNHPLIASSIEEEENLHSAPQVPASDCGADIADGTNPISEHSANCESSEQNIQAGSGDSLSDDSFPRAGEGENSLAFQTSLIGQEPASSALPEATPEFSLVSVVESILFTSQKPVSAREVLQILRGAAATATEDPLIQSLAKHKEGAIREAAEELQTTYEQTGRSFEVKESATGWQLVTRPAFAPWLRQLFPENRPARLSAPALETLAIIAYRQPITRADIEAVRGVAVDGVMQTLLDRGLVKISGRADVPGRPLLYSTTQHFMEHFGLRDLCELPNSSELRSRPLPTAPVPPDVSSTPQETPEGTQPTDSPDEQEEIANHTKEPQ